jgi:hypothetical protein
MLSVEPAVTIRPFSFAAVVCRVSSGKTIEDVREARATPRNTPMSSMI